MHKICDSCENRGEVNGLSQESFCSSCVWHETWRKNNFKSKNGQILPTEKEHELKTDPKVFDDVVSGKKTFEIRKNDRNFCIGDVLKLRKTKRSGAAMAMGAPLEYLDAPFYALVTNIMYGPVYGLEAGWVIMSIKPYTTGE